MAYPESCFSELLGVRGLCESPAKAPQFWLDDLPGLDLSALANLATAETGTGKVTAERLIDTAARTMAANIQSMYDATYKVVNSLVNGCSACSYTTNYASGNQRGTLIKNLTGSQMSRIVLEKFVVRTNSTGLFTVVIDDGSADNIRTIPVDLTAGEDLEITVLNYATKARQVRLYFAEPGVSLAQLSCPSGSGCGCSGKAAAISDLAFTGTLNGIETQQAYGFLPCALLTCDPSDLLCYLAHSAPRVMGLALFYKTAELYFETIRRSVRNNRVASANPEDQQDDAKHFAKMYDDQLQGKGTRGIRDIVNTTLQQTFDQCVVCDSKLATSWAVG